MNIELLRNDWIKVLSKWSNDLTAIENLFQDLVDRYSASGRHYHTLKHIQDMLLLFEAHKLEIKCHDSFYLAIWFHDAVQGLGIDSEAESAQYSEDALKDLDVPEVIRMHVCELIILTKKHDWSKFEDGNLFVDIDMAILGAKEDEYKKYFKNCNKEYSSIPHGMYKRGRINFLESLLEKEHIFITKSFIDKYEERARSNIEREIEYWLS